MKHPNPIPLPIEHSPEALGLVSRQTIISFGKLHYITHAKRQSTEVMLFLHGFGSSWIAWTPILKVIQNEDLLPNIDIVLVDLPGFGTSKNKLQHLNSIELGHELLVFVRSLGYRKIHISGHSMGGFIALDMAAHNSKNAIASIHIISGSYFTLLKMVNEPLWVIKRAPQIAIFYWLQQFLSSNDRVATKLNSILRKSPLKKPGTIYQVGGPTFKYAAEYIRNYDARAAWQSIKIPIFAVFGERDRLVSRHDMHEFQNILPHSQITSIEASGHSSLIEYPHDVARYLYGQIKSL